jgi:hypothetical protein
VLNEAGSLEHLSRELIPWWGRIKSALESYGRKRMHAWWIAFTERALADPHDVEDEINARIADGDERTMQAILEGSHAAATAIELAVLPAIAMIGRRFVRGDLPAWFQRNSLAYLSSLSAEEVGHIRALVHVVCAAVGTAPCQLLHIWPKLDATTLVIDGKQPLQELSFVLPHAVHVMGELKRHGLGQDATGFQGVTPMGIMIEARVVRWLADALPGPSSATS